MPIKQLLVRESDSLDAALSLLDRNGFGMAFAVDADGRLVGRLGAADIEACLARGGSLSLNVRAAMTPDAGALPASANSPTPTPGVGGGNVIAVVDAERRPVDVATAGRPRRIPVAEPVLGGNELKYVTDCITTNWISSQGTYVRRFEEMLGERLGAAHVISASNGTAALHLALLGYGIGAGDEVIVPDLTFAATINTVIHAGATPVIVDVDRKTWNIDPALVTAAITPRTRAIMPVHLYGQPADMDPLLELARKHRLFIVEDAAQAHGAEYKGRRCGSMGDVGCFSFYPGKNLGAYGDGGGITTQRADLAETIRTLRNYGQQPKNVHPIKGYNSRLDTLQAAVLRVKLQRLEGWNEARRVAAARYHQLLAPTGLGLPEAAPYSKAVWHLYVVQTSQRAKLQAALDAAGVSHGIHYPTPVHLQGAFKELGLGPGSFPVAEALCPRILSLPIFPEITEAQLQRVAAACRAGV